MADGPSGPRDDEPVAEPVLEWLDEVAAAEGLSREAAVKYLVSSYWRLEEIVDLLHASEDGGADAREAAELEDLNARFDSLVDDLQARRDRDGERRPTGLGERLDELEDAMGPAPEPEGDDLADRVDALEARLDELAASAASEEAVADLTRQTRSFQDSISRDHDALRDRVQTEFTHIRTILTHLLDATQSSEDGTERLLEEFRDTLRAHLADRETLEAITRTANRRGVRRADCGHCGATVDLAMLNAPTCPSCEHRFVDLETTSGPLGLFSSSTLLVD